MLSLKVVNVHCRCCGNNDPGLFGKLTHEYVLIMTSSDLLSRWQESDLPQLEALPDHASCHKLWHVHVCSCSYFIF